MNNATYANIGYVGGIAIAFFFLYQGAVLMTGIVLLTVISFLLFRIHIAGTGVAKPYKSTAQQIREDHEKQAAEVQA